MGRSAAAAAAVLLLAAAPVGASRMPRELTAAAGRANTRATLATARFAGAGFAALDALGDASATAPQQLHLSLTGDGTSMAVMWVTMGPTNGSAVSWWPAAGGPQPPPSPPTAPAQTRTYTAGLFGWSGTNYVATMTGLTPGVRYTYTVGSGPSGGAGWSMPRSFLAPAPPGPTATTRVAVLADMGTIVPLGWAVADRLISEHTLGPAGPFNMTMISGDLSYATIDPPKDEVEWTWDAWSIQNEAFASTAPHMTVVGNHEATPGNVTGVDGVTAANVSFAAFTSRFEMPGAASGGNANFWFSWDHGPAHWVALSSEHDYSAGSAQLAWLAADLARVDRAVTPWVIVSLHRPVYSSDASEWPAHSPGCPLATALEPLLAPASPSSVHVDLVIQGHMHCYERVHPVRNGSVVTPPTPGPDNSTLYVSPGAPVYVVQGTSGAVQRETFVDPPPAWSATRSNGVYGFARLTLSGATRLDWEFVDMYGTVQDAWAIVKSA